MPFGWGDSEQAYNQVQSENTGSLGHEVFAGAASFGAFKIFEDKQRKEGKPVSHAFAKELLAGLAGAEIDKLIETKGADFVDRERAKHAAKENVEKMYEDHYGSENQYDPNSCDPHQSLNNY